MAAKRKAAPRKAPKARALCAVKLATAEALRAQALSERHTGTALVRRVEALEALVAALVEAR